MKNIYAVMQSQEGHDASDAYGDFRIGVKLGALGFNKTFLFEQNPSNLSPMKSEYQFVEVFCTEQLSDEDFSLLAPVFDRMRSDGGLYGKKSVAIGGKTVKCFAWYEDAITEFEKEHGPLVDLDGGTVIERRG